MWQVGVAGIENRSFPVRRMRFEIGLVLAFRLGIAGMYDASRKGLVIARKLMRDGFHRPICIEHTVIKCR
jgi:hypothetical protein